MHHSSCFVLKSWPLEMHQQLHRQEEQCNENITHVLMPMHVRCDASAFWTVETVESVKLLHRVAPERHEITNNEFKLLPKTAGARRWGTHKL